MTPLLHNCMSPLVRLLLKVKTLNTIKAIPTSAEWSLFRFSTLRCVVGFKTRSRQKKRSFYPKRNLKFLICKNKSLGFVHHSGKHQNCLFTEIQIRSFSSAHCSLKIFQLKGINLGFTLDSSPFLITFPFPSKPFE